MYRLASVNTTSLLRCLGALVALIALVLLGGAGLPSVAFAADSDPSPSMTVDIKLVIYDNETSDLTVSMKVEGTPASLYCTEALLDNNDSFEVKADGDTCTLGLYGADIDDVEGGAMSIEHKGGTYTAKISDFKDFKDSKNTTVTMIFPGEVIDADTNAEVKGNTVQCHIPRLRPRRGQGHRRSHQHSQPDSDIRQWPESEPGAERGSGRRVLAPALVDRPRGRRHRGHHRHCSHRCYEQLQETARHSGRPSRGAPIRTIPHAAVSDSTGLPGTASPGYSAVFRAVDLRATPDGRLRPARLRPATTRVDSAILDTPEKRLRPQWTAGRRPTGTTAL